MPETLSDMTEPELAALFNRIARAVVDALPENTAFIVLASPAGRNQVAQYVSNVPRDQAAQWMLETVLRWHRNDFVPRDGHEKGAIE